MYPFESPGISLGKSFKAAGITVCQPFGEFVVTSLPANILLDTAYSDRLAAKRNADGTYDLSGSQRALAEPRLKDIGKFIDTGMACFPNAIILAANYRELDGLEEEDEDLRWTFQAEKGNTGYLRIPSPDKIAAIIDGQHRLFGFNYATNADRLEMPLVCAVFFELPKPYQARLFATINANQRPVSKSQTYELFGYNMEEEPPEKWTPEKLSVFLARKLNADESSPFFEHIVVPAENDFSVSQAAARRAGGWAISLAPVVEGTLRLISTNPKQDAYQMAGELRYEGHNRSVLEPAADPIRTPLRELFRDCNDEIIYTALHNYFVAVSDTLWRDAGPDNFLRRTVGVQALFDISKRLLYEGTADKNLRVSRFVEAFRPAKRVNFSDRFFHASGASRTTIRKTLEFAMGLSEPQEADPNYRQYLRLLGA